MKQIMPVIIVGMALAILAVPTLLVVIQPTAIWWAAGIWLFIFSATTVCDAMSTKQLRLKPDYWAAILIYATTRLVIGVIRFFKARFKKKEAARPRRAQATCSSECNKLYRLEPLEIVLGMRHGRPVKLNLARAHHLIGGSTGAGKTNAINLILTQLVPRSGDVEIVLVDLKGDIDDHLYRWAPVVDRYERDLDRTADLLTELLKEMRERHLGERERKYKVVIIDEIASLTKHGERGREFSNLLAELARQARSAQFKLVFATQQPDFKTIPTSIRINLTTKWCLPTDTMDQAKIILGFQPSRLLSKPGDTWLRRSLKVGKGERVQLWHVQAEEITKTAQIAVQQMVGADDLGRLFAHSAGGRVQGDPMIGINKSSAQLELSNAYVRRAYALLRELEIVTSPNGRGDSHFLAMDYNEAVRAIRDARMAGKVLL